VDFKAQTVDLGGTYVPLYGLNSALGAIPILGRVLVGRQGEGVVGITFAIKGKLDGPQVLVNPMSVMTPGIFRQIFEFTGSVPEPGAANAPSSYTLPGQ
jgi:AsmA-like C-terminal region